jgi:hypothetical protein
MIRGEKETDSRSIHSLPGLSARMKEKRRELSYLSTTNSGFEPFAW